LREVKPEVLAGWGAVFALGEGAMDRDTSLAGRVFGFFWAVFVVEVELELPWAMVCFYHLEGW
jgi:hypothetical protein